jgi:hypothetical protein
MTKGQATQRFKPYQFVLLREGLTHAEFSRKFKKGTITRFLFDNNLVEECIAWLKVNHVVNLPERNQPFNPVSHG